MTFKARANESRDTTSPKLRPRPVSLDSRLATVYVHPMRAAFRNLPPLILASASPRRVELLRQLSLDFKVVPGNVPEIHHDQLTAR